MRKSFTCILVVSSPSSIFSLGIRPPIDCSPSPSGFTAIDLWARDPVILESVNYPSFPSFFCTYLHTSHYNEWNINVLKQSCSKVGIGPDRIPTFSDVKNVKNNAFGLSNVILGGWSNFFQTHKKDWNGKHGQDIFQRNIETFLRHNGPEGWVHITSSNTNLDQISSSEPRASINFKISTKHQPQLPTSSRGPI